jgi:hypothetical protein
MSHIISDIAHLLQGRQRLQRNLGLHARIVDEK